jgi:predicted CXXCH cytochrome family protein
MKLLNTSPLAVLLVLVLFVSAGEAVGSVRDISAKRECAICHIMWLNEFQQEDVTPLIPYDPKPVVDTGKQDIVSTERVCFSCHDGFIMDSRFAWVRKKYFHPVGVVPSEKVNIPTRDGRRLFPLNNEGKIYCGTCHSAHGVSWKQKESPIFLRAKNIESSLCLACHLDRSTGPKEGNHPVYRPIEKVEKELVDFGAKFGVKDGRATVICQSCHRIHGARDKKALVAPNENSALCGHCHVDRYAKDRKEAAAMGTHPVNVKSSKVKIAEEITDAGGKIGKNGEIICQTCHSPHYAKYDATILVKRNIGSSLCKTCHSDKKMVANTKHDLSLSEGNLTNIREQTVEDAGTCSACHVPHGGNGLKMWARPLKEGEDDMAALCYSCHSEGHVAENKQVGKETHPIGKKLSNLGNNDIELSGYSKEGKPVKGGGRVSCPSCHNPHQWDPNDPAVKAKPGSKSDASTRFLRVANDTTNSPLCLKCHTDKSTIVGTKHDAANIEGVERGKGVCATCHSVHKGKGPRMWAQEPKEGVDPVSSLCKSCHDKKGVGKEKLVGVETHPVGVPIKNLGIKVSSEKWTLPDEINSDNLHIQALPLFDEKGSRSTQESANVACATCHDPHRWSAEQSTEESDPLAEGDGKNSFLRIANRSDGELCANCHFDKLPVVKSKHNIGKFAPENENDLGQPAGKNYVCGNCHVPHNAKGKRLWARTLDKRLGVSEAMCRSCHEKTGVAKDKLVGDHSHPLGVDVRKLAGKSEPTLPLYNKKGEQKPAKHRGRVSCPSCHNPHQWDPDDGASMEGAEMDVEGDANNSFLRKPAAPNGELCVDCHKVKRWIEGTDHDLAVTVPGAVDSNNRKISSTGVCGQCHSVHNAKGILRLWARETGEGQDPQEELCRSCHITGKIAENKQPVKAVHPKDVEAVVVRKVSHKGAYTPLFDKNGNVADRGVITCPTCHNPHKWSALRNAKGSGRNLEGNARNSFLRNRSKLSLCSTCHGLDALFRYKYFHGKSSRSKHDLYRTLK